MVWMGAARARYDLHDNGRGQTFLRAILFPAALLLIVLMASRAHEAHGIPVLGPPRQPLYTWLVTGGLIGSASWLTFAWSATSMLSPKPSPDAPPPPDKTGDRAANQATDSVAAVEPASASAPTRPAGTAPSATGSPPAHLGDITS